MTTIFFAVYLVSGALQAWGAVLSGSILFRALDDVALALFLYKPLQIFARRLTALSWLQVALVSISLVAGFVIGNATLSEKFLILRQLAFPILLFACGSVISREAIVRIQPLVVGIGVVTVVFGFALELLALIGTVDFGEISKSLNETTFTSQLVIDGRLGSFWYSVGGQNFVRNIGLYLSPPVSGVAIAAGLVALGPILQHRLSLRVAIVAGLLSIGLISTFSRAGIIIVLSYWLGTVVQERYQSRTVVKGRRFRFSRAMTLVVVLAFVSLVAIVSGGAASHLGGLFNSFKLLIQTPGGVGFGAAGNIVKASGPEKITETYFGLLAVHVGVIALLPILYVGFKVIRSALMRHNYASLGIISGLIFCTLFSETIVAISASGFLLVVAGNLSAALLRPSQNDGKLLGAKKFGAVASSESKER